MTAMERIQVVGLGAGGHAKTLVEFWGEAEGHELIGSTDAGARQWGGTDGLSDPGGGRRTGAPACQGRAGGLHRRGVGLQCGHEAPSPPL